MAGGWAAFGAGLAGGIADQIDTEGKRQHDLQKSRDNAVTQALVHYSSQFPTMYQTAVKEAQTKRDRYQGILSLAGGDFDLADLAMQRGIDPKTSDAATAIQQMTIKRAEGQVASKTSAYMQEVQSQLTAMAEQGNQLNNQITGLQGKPKEPGFFSKLLGIQQEQKPQISMPGYTAPDVANVAAGPSVDVGIRPDANKLVESMIKSLDDNKEGVWTKETRAQAAEMILKVRELANKPRRTPEEDKQLNDMYVKFNSLQGNTTHPENARMSALKEAARARGYTPGSEEYTTFVATGKTPEEQGKERTASGKWQPALGPTPSHITSSARDAAIAEFGGKIQFNQITGQMSFASDEVGKQYNEVMRYAEKLIDSHRRDSWEKGNPKPQVDARNYVGMGFDLMKGRAGNDEVTAAAAGAGTPQEAAAAANSYFNSLPREKQRQISAYKDFVKKHRQ